MVKMTYSLLGVVGLIPTENFMTRWRQEGQPASQNCSILLQLSHLQHNAREPLVGGVHSIKCFLHFA